MAAYQLLTIFMAFFLVQSYLAKPLDDLSSSKEDIRKNTTTPQQIILFVIDNYVSSGQYYSVNGFNISSNLLKDKSLMPHENPEVFEFKKNLTMFIEKSELIKKPEKLLNIIDIYIDTIKKNTDVPEEKLNP